MKPMIQNAGARGFSLVLLVCLLCLAAAPASAGLIVGLPPDGDTGNCVPFGCGYNGVYQQVYTHGLFATGPIIITGLDFYNTVFDNSAFYMNSGTWTFSLSTSTADWNTLSTNAASNLGSGNTQVFSGNLAQSWLFGNTLSITLSTPFTYNPANGNLLLNVAASGVTSPGGDIYFDTNGLYVPNTFMSQLTYDAVDGWVVVGGYGLVTGFDYSSAPSVPEPASFALLAGGLFGLGLLRRRLRR
jgi:hypothetical protein